MRTLAGVSSHAYAGGRIVPCVPWGLPRATLALLCDVIGGRPGDSVNPCDVLHPMRRYRLNRLAARHRCATWATSALERASLALPAPLLPDSHSLRSIRRESRESATIPLNDRVSAVL
jgi:hypothetical protein